MKPGSRSSLIFKDIVAIILAGSALQAQAIERVRPGDAGLDCARIFQENRSLDAAIAAGDPDANAVGKAAAGTAANVGGQVAGATVAQSVGGIFGALGGVVAKVTGVAAQQATEEKMQPDAAARQQAAEAAARKDFLTRLAAARECRPDDPSHPGKPLDAAQFQQLAAAGPVSGLGAQLTPLTADSVLPSLGEPVSLLPANDLFEGKLDLKGKRFYIAEFRVLFDVGGQSSASTRGGYLPGRDYGSTRAKVNYKVPNVDVAAYQAITDKAWEDLKARLAAAGARLEDRDAFVRENGAIYEAGEEASKPGAPVFIEKNFGHSERKFLVMAPTGMKVHARGFAGLGAGNIGKRIEWSKTNLEALSISVAVNIAALESSGSGSSIFKRESSASAGEGMSISMAPDTLLVQSHTNTNILRMTRALPVEGSFARFREAGGYDTDKDAVGRTMGILTNLAGMGANKTKRTDLEVDLDGPATARLALQGLATINQAVAEHVKNGL